MSKKDDKIESLDSTSLAQVISQAVAAGIEQGLARVRAVAPEDLTPEEKKVVEEAAGQELQRQLTEPRYLVTVHRAANKDAVDPVPINVNGILRTVRRGEPSVMLGCMIEVLEHSVEDRPSEERDAQGFASGKIERVQCYPYSVHRELDPTEWNTPVADLVQKYVPGQRQLARAA